MAQARSYRRHGPPCPPGPCGPMDRKKSRLRDGWLFARPLADTSFLRTGLRLPFVAIRQKLSNLGDY